MTYTSSHSVFGALEASQAVQLNHCRLNSDLALARWRNAHDRVRYQKVDHHTLSLYISGGTRTRRLDQLQRGYGAPGVLCLMPSGADSDWEVGIEQDFIHLYISEAGLKLFALEAFDIDPRRVSLPDLTFFEHPQITAALDTVLQIPWSYREDWLLLQQASADVMAALLQSFVLGQAAAGSFKGGLTQFQLNRVKAYMEAHLGDGIGLEDLAKEVGLSVFHFARMFKATLGLTPHQYLSKCRNRRALEQLRANLPLVEVAANCGFTHQSHMTAHFKKEYGVSPKVLQREFSGVKSPSIFSE